MIFALDNHGQKVRATPGQEGMCPLCNTRMVAKCGTINLWHWAHFSRHDCDSWAETETLWHAHFKRLVPPQWTEVTIEKNGVRHRADIVLPGGTIVELQHSPISEDVIGERETFYEKMIWLFDVRDCAIELRKKANAYYHTFRWKWPRKHIAFTGKPTYLALSGESVMRLKNIWLESPCGGWGHVKHMNVFEQWIKNHFDGDPDGRPTTETDSTESPAGQPGETSA